MHTYDSCKDDILAAKQTRPRFISGHDYITAWPGVMRAVDDVLGKPEKVWEDGSWIKRM